MGWAVGYDGTWNRDIGYGVPAVCDHPDCDNKIDRGLAYVCGSEPYGGDEGCGLYFCPDHLRYKDSDVDETRSISVCEACADEVEPFTPKPDVRKWVMWKLLHPSWQEWRERYEDEAAALLAQVGPLPDVSVLTDAELEDLLDGEHYEREADPPGATHYCICGEEWICPMWVEQVTTR